jgi:hypothetical protein
VRLILAGPDRAQGLRVLSHAGHAVVALADAPEKLARLAAQEAADGVLVTAPCGPDATTLAQHLADVAAPVVVRRPADWPPAPLAAVAALVDTGTPWAAAVAALAHAPRPEARGAELAPAKAWTVATPTDETPTNPTGADAKAATLPEKTETGTPQCPACGAPLITPRSEAVQRTPAPAPREAAARPLLLLPVLGGVGASSLALALAAAGAEAGRPSLAVTSDPLAFSARLGPGLERPDVVAEVQAHLAALRAGERFRLPQAAYEVVVWDLGRGGLTADLAASGPSLLLTRPTGEGRLALAQAVADVARMGGRVCGAVTGGTGSLAAPDLARLCAEDGAGLPWIEALPLDAQVPALEETDGHALDAPLYGPAVRALARRLWPHLPWPPAPETSRRSLGQRLFEKIEFVD